MDPLSHVLSLLKPHNYLSGGFMAGGAWSIQFPDQQKGIKCSAIVAGECWLIVDGVADAVYLKAGDCILLPSGRPFRLATDLTMDPLDAEPIFADPNRSNIVSLNSGGDFLLISNRFALTDSHATLLLNMLSPIVHIPYAQDQTTLRWWVERMMQEMQDPQPGGFLVMQHLAHMMLVEALRLHLKDRLNGGVGWLFALADKQMSATMTALHDDPARRWNLQDLAAVAGMSRSSFALKFKQTVGTSPMDYLTHWRMMLAADRLKHSREPIATIALSLGYESESAFSTAFKRVMGCPPRHYTHSRGATLAVKSEMHQALPDEHPLAVAQ
ncbi:AraC family transcriptional regulator [Rhizobium sp.]|uniref:AraC family transcriptional regulator n=1 Tax=Rhizobium sp. TaxID=391 RepID=UPI000E8DBCDF|nr:AraC family transcriptional regulator [Rhizobium sp.]